MNVTKGTMRLKTWNMYGLKELQEKGIDLSTERKENVQFVK